VRGSPEGLGLGNRGGLGVADRGVDRCGWEHALAHGLYRAGPVLRWGYCEVGVAARTHWLVSNFVDREAVACRGGVHIRRWWGNGRIDVSGGYWGREVVHERMIVPVIRPVHADGATELLLASYLGLEIDKRPLGRNYHVGRNLLAVGDLGCGGNRRICGLNFLRECVGSTLQRVTEGGRHLPRTGQVVGCGRSVRRGYARCYFSVLPNHSDHITQMQGGHC
jgi:hypothetical protein